MAGWHASRENPQEALGDERPFGLFHNKEDLMPAFARWMADGFGSKKPTLEAIRAERDSIDVYWNMDLDTLLDRYIRLAPSKEDKARYEMD